MRLVRIAVALLLLAAAPGAPGASAAVEYGSVTATCEAGPVVRFRWLTLLEEDTNGFKVFREGPNLTEVASWVDAHGPDLEYEIVDLAPETVAASSYWVQELTSTGFGDRSAPASTTEVPPPDQGNVLLAARSGLDVLLTFPLAPDAPWGVYRDGDRRSTGGIRVGPVTTVPAVQDTGAVALPESAYYHVKGVTDCSHVPGP